MKFEIETKGAKRRVSVTEATPEQISRIGVSLRPFCEFHGADDRGWANIRPSDCREVGGILTVIAAPASLHRSATILTLRPAPVGRCLCRKCGERSPARFTTLPIEAQICDDCA